MSQVRTPPPSTIRDCSSIQMRMPSRGRSRHSERNVIHIFVKDLALLFHAKARMIFMKSSLLVSLEAILSCWSQPAQALQLGSFLAHCACHNAGRVLGDGRGSPTIRSCFASKLLATVDTMHKSDAPREDGPPYISRIELRTEAFIHTFLSRTQSSLFLFPLPGPCFACRVVVCFVLICSPVSQFIFTCFLPAFSLALHLLPQCISSLISPLPTSFSPFPPRPLSQLTPFHLTQFLPPIERPPRSQQ